MWTEGKVEVRSTTEERVGWPSRNEDSDKIPQFGDFSLRSQLKSSTSLKRFYIERWELMYLFNSTTSWLVPSDTVLCKKYMVWVFYDRMIWYLQTKENVCRAVHSQLFTANRNNWIRYVAKKYAASDFTKKKNRVLNWIDINTFLGVFSTVNLESKTNKQITLEDTSEIERESSLKEREIIVSRMVLKEWVFGEQGSVGALESIVVETEGDCLTTVWLADGVLLASRNGFRFFWNDEMTHCCNFLSS